ncbi:LytR/AlgR family response regulator transcription factor [Blastomonas sp. SL216]|uniref:LytR/AlgR family response regulator transcription factor n=1 Tax=Blastomonas sp. SL216 TaxID=2995169 RepID=UPI00237771FA|nr:LytTR family DNA-binding domain-containing protein [Blastomonas sp. SL216]
MKLLPADRPIPGLAGRLQRSPLAAALLFCLSTFVISAFRASLNPDTVFELFHPKRTLLIAAGALVFWTAISGTSGRRPGWATLRRLALTGLPGLAMLFALANGWDMLVSGEVQDMTARNLRWILLWSGYFGTGLAAWLALQYGAALAEAEQQAADQSEAMGTRTPDADGGFWVKTGRQTIRIPHALVEWIEAEGNYVRIHALDGGHGLIRSTLAAIESQLPHEEFIRIHRSALCRRSAIRGYRRKPSGAMLALLASGAEAPIGRSFARALTAQIQRPNGHPSDMDDTVSRPASGARAT